MNKVKPVPRDVVESKFPELKGKPLWGDKKEYTPEECRELNYVAYGPIDLQGLAMAHRYFKTVKIVKE
jgi:hypothetical protein